MLFIKVTPMESKLKKTAKLFEHQIREEVTLKFY